VSVAGTSSNGLRIVLAGATGALGQEVREALASSSLPIAALVPVATEDSIGAEIDFRGEVLFVESALSSLRGVDLLILCTPPAASLELIRAALRSEVPCIDCSSALGESRDVPVVVTGRSSSSDLTAPVVATLSGIALGWVRVLAALDAVAGVERVVGTVLQPATRAGRQGIEVLSSETIALLSQSELPESDTFPSPVAFACLPIPRAFEDTLRRDVAWSLAKPIEIAVSSVQVPTFVGEGSALTIQTARPVSPDEACGLLEKAEGVELWGSERIPTTRDTAGSDQVLVGNVRSDPSRERGLQLWIATDGLRLVACEVVKIAETRLRLN
jgi:aspartate-semialdehyde dehydrogenase